jgi:hypothetical protein
VSNCLDEICECDEEAVNASTFQGITEMFLYMIGQHYFLSKGI